MSSPASTAGALDSGVEQLLAGTPSGSDEGAERQAFRAWQTLAHEVTSGSVDRPVLLVLDDLHWADTATLKVLRHLVSTAGDGHHLAVLVTRRSWPEPSGALAEVGEELARRHVTRLDLSGLTLEEAQGAGGGASRAGPSPPRWSRSGTSGPAATRTS